MKQILRAVLFVVVAAFVAGSFQPVIAATVHHRTHNRNAHHHGRRGHHHSQHRRA